MSRWSIRSGSGDDGEGERGQALVVVLALIAVWAAVVGAALAETAGRTLDRVRAQTAADAAALASLEGGRPGAANMATGNGATLVAWQRGPGPDEVTVVVTVGSTRATARATNAP